MMFYNNDLIESKHYKYNILIGNMSESTQHYYIIFTLCYDGHTKLELIKGNGEANMNIHVCNVNEIPELLPNTIKNDKNVFSFHYPMISPTEWYYEIPITNEIINLINFNEYINKLYEKSIKDIVDALNKK